MPRVSRAVLDAREAARAVQWLEGPGFDASPSVRIFRPMIEIIDDVQAHLDGQTDPGDRTFNWGCIPGGNPAWADEPANV